MTQGVSYNSMLTPLFLTALASANTTPDAGFSLIISHDVFARITAVAIGLPVRRSFDCWNSTISERTAWFNVHMQPTGQSNWSNVISL